VFLHFYYSCTFVVDVADQYSGELLLFLVNCKTTGGTHCQDHMMPDDVTITTHLPATAVSYMHQIVLSKLHVLYIKELNE